MTTDGRVRLSLGSVLSHTAQWHPIIGTPALVPVPRNSSSTSSIRRGYSGPVPRGGTVCSPLLDGGVPVPRVAGVDRGHQLHVPVAHPDVRALHLAPRGLVGDGVD